MELKFTICDVCNPDPDSIDINHGFKLMSQKDAILNGWVMIGKRIHCPDCMRILRSIANDKQLVYESIESIKERSEV
jgi:hypothetical protein